MTMFREASCELDREARREKLTFFVAGAGFTGVEMAGELAELVPVLCKRFEIDRSEVSIKTLDMLERICPVLPEKQAAKVECRLKKMHVDLMLKTRIKEVGPDYVAYAQGQDAVKVKNRTVIWTAGIEGSDLVQASRDLPQAGRARVRTDMYLRALDHPDVYVAGDNIFYTPEGTTEAVPHLVENAEASAETIAHNVLAAMTQTGEQKAYNPVFHGVMVCAGGRYEQAHIGLAGKRVSLPSFLAMFVKHFVNIMYFIKTLGWNKAFSYMNHEFFQIRNKRSFVGGHFSNRSATFMLAPLRVYLGAYWMYEGIMKIRSEGWLSGPKLADFFNGAKAFYDRVLNPAAATAGASVDEAVAGASEAIAGATEAAADALSRQPEALLNVDIFRWIRLIFIDCGDAASNAFKIQAAPIDWLVNTLVLSSDTMQNLMQRGILFAEILVGLALISGLFTTAAGAVSLALQFMFLTTTGLYMATWWMVFASVAVMFGAGRVLSLDYYVMPALGRRWAKLKFVKRWYLYNDGL
jgi:NADH dehydrogenase